MPSLMFHRVSFAYDSSADGLFRDLTFGLSDGWTGVIGPNGGGKTTLLRLSCGEISPRRGTITAPAGALYCPQRTDEAMPEFAQMLDAVDGDAYRVRSVLGIEDDWLLRWQTLSHGERKRAQIATCLWLKPELLAIDEPTNHLDQDARRRVHDALSTYRGIGLLVSHDRELLDALCFHCVFVHPPTAILRSGGYTTAVESLQEDERCARERKREASRQRHNLQRELQQRRLHQRKAEAAKSLRGVARKDHDARAKAFAARNSDGGSGKRLRQLEGRVRHLREAEQAIRITPPRELGIGLETSSSRRNTVLFEPSGSLSLGHERQLVYPELIVQPTDRVALMGPNGSGKSTLLRHLVAHLTLPPERYLYIPQEVTAEHSAQLLQEIRSHPRSELGQWMAWVSRLGSDPERILDSHLPSPGEVRKLMLARRLQDEPHLILMDEPTNHMDLPSIECLEAALHETPCALVLVSHDARFLDRLTSIRWQIDACSQSPGCCTLRIHRTPRSR